ncbi:S9 family peptidase [Parasegetibacter sp. NRK P23]|uniref:S9 family peptidase n=1 Tax=Parasegetibacter sp. NRK P23 TaxID=2942999 RepID=UPI002042D98D|nr:S9 family peptidase [Parasegetibacter sp. NRK P23]MCM5527973.1 S9 family peptidase [Parasegetibacter sp. NRK P23]
MQQLNRRNTLWMGMALAGMSIAFSAAAQQKELTRQQMLLYGLPETISKPLPRISQWTDDTHYVVNKGNPQRPDLYEVDAKTGKETPYTFQRPASDGMVRVKNNDLYYTGPDKVEKRLTNDPALEVNPEMSPDNRFVAFTKENNLYTIDLQSGKETKLTSDGSDVILNGYSSWVYMEEILGRPTRHRAFWWSPDSKSLAFFRSDDTKVPVFTMTDGNGTRGYVETLRYPKPGDANPEVKVGIVAATGGAVTWADFNAAEDQYFGMPIWMNDSKTLWQSWMNRGQDQLKIYAVSTENGSKKLIYEETQKTWIDLDNANRFTFLESGKGFILQSDKSGWNMMYLHDMTGKQLNPITNGEFTVTDILLVDEKKSTVFFTARKENTARVDLYSVKLNGKDLKRLTFGDYNHQVSLSPNASYFVTTYQNAATAPKIALVDGKGKLIREIADSKGTEADQYRLAKTELIRVKSDDGLYELPALVTWPLDYDPAKKYPVLISIYGGPNAGTVMDRFSLGAQQQWYAKEGMIQVAMDHRASGHFGKKGQNFIHRNLGYWETKDYSTIVKHLISKGADPARICITGFSYGGYMSCYALTYGADVFTHGMAGGSVTDWRLYDTHYTERFMDTPEENPEGYKSSSVLTHADKYKGKLQIVHGIIDENVHMQNSIQLISRLQDLKKDFEMMIYSGGRHGWGGNKGLHFQNLKTEFVYKNLLQKEMPAELRR